MFSTDLTAAELTIKIGRKVESFNQMTKFLEYYNLNLDTNMFYTVIFNHTLILLGFYINHFTNKNLNQ